MECLSNDETNLRNECEKVLQKSNYGQHQSIIIMIDHQQWNESADREIIILAAHRGLDAHLISKLHPTL